MDFTLSVYSDLIQTYLRSGYKPLSLCKFLSNTFSSEDKIVILRHDVDSRSQNSIRMAKKEHGFGVHGTYFFRSKNHSFNEESIKKIQSLGHEIGYHYEDLSRSNGDYNKAIESFKTNLSCLRDICEIKTISMHGAPLTKWDNRLLWNKFDYREYGIIGEPYFDIDYAVFLYITDTARTWAETQANLRDRVHSRHKSEFKSTNDIIEALHQNRLPNKIIQTVHPQRWNDGLLRWTDELIRQNVKNLGKIVLKKTGIYTHTPFIDE